MTDSALRPFDEARTEEMVNFLWENADAAGLATAKVRYEENMLKVLRAVLMQDALEQSGGKLSVSAQERDAYAHPRYLEQVKKASRAVHEEQTQIGKRKAAIMQIDAWRTWNANHRTNV